MNMPIPDPNRKYTYQDYLTWSSEERWELVDGDVYNMTPSPSYRHQQISLELSAEFAIYLREKKCRAITAPFDVLLFPDEGRNVVQPDLFIVCDRNKIEETVCKGSPDLIVEILSPSTGKHDKWIKYRLYERAGVQEYWIVDPVNETVDVFKLENGRYLLSGAFGKEDSIKVGIFDDLSIDLSRVFRE